MMIKMTVRECNKKKEKRKRKRKEKKAREQERRRGKNKESGSHDSYGRDCNVKQLSKNEKIKAMQQHEWHAQ